MAEEFEPIHIVELVISEVGSPENNGTKSGTLYSIPFKLSREAPAEWADLCPSMGSSVVFHNDVPTWHS